MVSKQDILAPWTWRKPEERGESVWTPPLIESYKETDKMLTIVSWDACYREQQWLDLSFQCLEKQTIRDRVDFIHIEWSNQRNPFLDKFPFLQRFYMNFENDSTVWPRFDIGLQWNLGLFLARTPYVVYFHNDLIIPEQLEIIENKVKNNPNIVLFTGYEVNHKGKSHPLHQEEFFCLLKDDPENFDKLPLTYNGPFKRGPHPNASLATVHKKKLIKKYNGFFWNLLMERWDGLGYKRQPGCLSGKGLLRLTNKQKIGLRAQRDMAVFSIPHGKQGTRSRVKESRSISTNYKYYDKLCYYSDMVSDWLPYHPFDTE